GSSQIAESVRPARVLCWNSIPSNDQALWL
ncbi:uncharacterized protein METZ01_LOCUS404265, partial [marine metagenome]